MKCVACNVSLTPKQYKDELCSVCRDEVFLALQDFPEEPVSQWVSEGDLGVEFDAYVAQRGLMERWSDGLGLMPVRERQKRMMSNTFTHYKRYREDGLSPLGAIEKATGFHRGKQDELILDVI